ncbi:uncharacterized protein TEOVI_000670200 [Trypanosoma equiperdum]|uniref:Translin-associated factor X-interacting protein 1 N-terminal domain-containing protein n=2 Tax=Trypanozoon TaxID=39700 RepID=Q585Y0_TRYB2|nr:hypothetical protein, conserved [Trypanosoma brucei brucei TREU927]AAX80757.1 hypothetical protein, conserved [Trypanosoma brucei]AAZ11941.1 hypothetical protein, conserved [Trypanosoma brucei brucei TREU927]SCU68115.1 hypothetical protein, conserved [Trypanosoma equiperdum]
MESSVYSGTMPVKGVLYMTSPCMPSAALNSGMHLPTLPYNPLLQSKRGTAAWPANPNNLGVLQGGLKDTKSALNRQKTAEGADTGTNDAAAASGNTGSRKGIPIKEPVRGRTGRKIVQPLPGESSSNRCSPRKPVQGSVESFKSLKSMLSKSTDTKWGAATTSFLETGGGMAQTMNSFMSSGRDPPPLATTLAQYLQKEVSVAVDEGGVCTAQSRLRPFREALFVLIDAFPAYSQILNDIMSAYDGVIQEQAAMLIESMNERQRQERVVAQRGMEVQELNSTITRLTAELKEVRDELEDDGDDEVTEEGDTAPIVVPQPGRRSLKGFKKMERNLLRANATIQKLEETNKDHLEKVLVLIAALRESDKRAKKVEKEYQDLVSKVDELSEFKIMAGEAQSELEEFKEKYSQFISITDHNIVKEQLMAELQAAQAAGRHNRRAAAVRGMQVDVMGRKFKAIKEENAQLLNADIQRDVMTPRPKWDEVHEKVPALKEYVKSVRALPLEGDEAITSVVPGMTETVLQVDFLVEQIHSLSNEVDRRAMVPMKVETPHPPMIGRCQNKNNPVHLCAAGVVPYVELDQMTVLSIVHDFFSSTLVEHPDVLLPTIDVPKIYLHYLNSVIETRPGLEKFTQPEHLAINMDYIARSRERCRPSLKLLTGILDGIYPSRLACDVIAIIENVRTELKELATAQKRSRLRRTAVADCIAPVLQLKTEKDVALLKEALGVDTTHDVGGLISLSGKFMSTFFDQECASAILFYCNLIERLTLYSERVDQEGGVNVITYDNVNKAIMEVEPLTPRPVLRELSEKSMSKSTFADIHAARLRDIISVLGSAPVIRRSPLQPEGCTL